MSINLLFLSLPWVSGGIIPEPLSLIYVFTVGGCFFSSFTTPVPISDTNSWTHRHCNSLLPSQPTKKQHPMCPAVTEDSSKVDTTWREASVVQCLYSPAPIGQELWAQWKTGRMLNSLFMRNKSCPFNNCCSFNDFIAPTLRFLSSISSILGRRYCFY